MKALCSKEVAAGCQARGADPQRLYGNGAHLRSRNASCSRRSDSNQPNGDESLRERIESVVDLSDIREGRPDDWPPHLPPKSAFAILSARDSLQTVASNSHLKKSMRPIDVVLSATGSVTLLLLRVWSEAHRLPGEGPGAAYYPPDDAQSGRVTPICFVPAQFVQSERTIRAICRRDSCLATLLTEEQSRRGQPKRQRGR
jgi:hypothetical protein